MRWFVLIFLLLPSFAIADKATRDRLLSYAHDVFLCATVFELGREDKFEKTQLLMQFEIDEELFSMEKIESYAKAFKTKIESDGKIDVSALTDAEIEYVEMQVASLISTSKEHAQKILSDPFKLSEEILSCVEKFKLNN